MRIILPHLKPIFCNFALMRYIANPIYDVVFKYLLEDPKVAKRFIGVIINKEILELELLPQEKTIQKEGTSLRIQRLDFVAQIKDKDGKISKILIEIQKSNKSYHADLLRFRGYLAKHYQIDDLPIVTIYILGFTLENLPYPAVHINRRYVDAYTGETIEVANEFAEKLTHDAWIIQVPRLKLVLRSKLSQLLEVFNQEYRASKDKEGSKFLAVPFEPDEDLKEIYERLERARADEAMREKLEDDEYFEMVYEEMFGSYDKKITELEEKLEEEKKRAEEKEKLLEEEKKRAEEKEKLLEEEKKRAEEEKKRAEENFQKMIELAKMLKSAGVETAKIAEKTGLPFEEIERL
jgi:hypothetical protein